MAKGGILIDRFGPEVGHLNYLAVPGVGILNFCSCRDHKSFPGVRNFSYFDLTIDHPPPPRHRLDNRELKQRRF